MILAGSKGTVVAAGTVPADGTYRLGEIVVSANEQNVTEKVGTTYRVTAEQIKEANVATLDEALELVPGLIIREGGVGTPRIDIRGFRTRHVQLFLNGIPVRDSYDGQFDPTRIPADIISEIKVTSGGGSVLYGAGGNGGAIDIITRSGVQGVQGSVGLEIGEGNRYKTQASIYGSGEKVDFFANLTVFNRDEYVLSDDFEATDYEDGGDRENSDRERVNVFTNVSYAVSDYTTLGLTVSHVSGENGKPPITNPDKKDPFAKSIKFERIDDLDNTLIQMGFENKSDGPVDLRGWMYYSQTDQEENGYDEGSNYTKQKKKGAFQQLTDTALLGVSGQARYTFDDLSFATLGLTAEDEDWESEGFEKTKNGEDDLADERDLQAYSLALEYEREMGDFGVVVGYGHHFQERDENDDDDFSYLIGVTWDMSDSTQFRLNHARKIRFPSIKQLYGKGGNEGLENEVSYHYEAGVHQKFGMGAVGLTGFIIDAEDFIEKIEVDGEETNVNFQEIRIAGVEADLTLRPLDNLMLRFAVTWLETEDESDATGRDELQYRPEWKLSAEGTYTFDFGLSVHASVLHVADQYFYDNDTQSLKAKLNDFTVTNLKLTQSFTDTGLELYAGVDNLFDEDYEESYGLPQPGRTVYGGVEYHF